MSSAVQLAWDRWVNKARCKLKAWSKGESKSEQSLNVSKTGKCQCYTVCPRLHRNSSAVATSPTTVRL